VRQEEEVQEVQVEGGVMRGDVFIAKRKEPGDAQQKATAAAAAAAAHQSGTPLGARVIFRDPKPLALCTMRTLFLRTE
jgi:hypothetical protein